MSNSVNPYIISPEQWERDRKAKKQPAVEKKSKANKNNRSRWQILNDFIDVWQRDLSRSEIAIWNILFRDTKPNGLIRVGYADLGRRGGVSRAQVVRAVKALVKKQLLVIVKTGSQETGVSTYRIPSVLGVPTYNGCTHP